MTPLEDRTVPTAVSITKISDAHEGGSSGTFRLTRDDTSGGLSVIFTLSGTGIEGEDFDWVGTNTGFGTGQATTDVTISALEDEFSEPIETVTMTLAGGMDYDLGSPTSATMNIYDNDAQYVSVAKVNDAVEGGTAGKFRLTRIGDLSSSLTANFSVGGTATSGTDFTSLGSSVAFAASSATADVNVTALPDNLVEGAETVTLTVTSGTGYTPTGSAASLTITDDPPVISVEATDTFEGAATGGFSFIRTGGDITQPLTIDYTVGGTATATTDYVALSGTLTFLANQDRVEVPVEAEGDNQVDDGETVTVEIDEDEGYEIDEGAADATVTIADQPLTISVMTWRDGEEGGNNPIFRFLRSGDLSEELTVPYSVSGTATSGVDFTAMDGSVTFGENDSYVDMVVTLQDDATAEPTETIVVTLNEPPDEDEDGNPDYSLGSDTDTVFIKDNDTGLMIWEGDDLSDPHNWHVADNWQANREPVEGDDVIFDGNVSDVDCVNAGDGLETLYGIHFVHGYAGTVTLANTLTVGTYEQGSGTFDLPGVDLTIDKAMLWTGGTLDSTATGANVNVDGASGRIDPPDIGSVSMSCTLRIVNNADVLILPGTINITGGLGMYLSAKSRWEANKDEVNVTVNRDPEGAAEALIRIVEDGSMKVTKVNPGKGGKLTLNVPVANSGEVFIQDGIHVYVKGQGLELTQGGQTTKFSYYQYASEGQAKTTLTAGCALDTDSGVFIGDGTLDLKALKGFPTATIVGDLRFYAGTLTFSGVEDPDPTKVVPSGELKVQGDINWTGGTYKPNVLKEQAGKASLWHATGKFTIGVDTTIDPRVLPESGGTWAADAVWLVLQGDDSLTGATSGHVPGGSPLEIYAGTPVDNNKRWLKKKSS